MVVAAVLPLKVFPVILTEPSFNAVTTPFALTVAIFLLLLVQVTLSVADVGLTTPAKLDFCPRFIAVILFEISKLVAGLRTVILDLRV